MKKNLLLFFLGMLFCTAQVMAQNKKITGKNCSRRRQLRAARRFCKN